MRLYLGEFVAVLGFEVALHIGHKLVEALQQVRLPVHGLRCNYPVLQSCVDLQHSHMCIISHPSAVRGGVDMHALQMLQVKSMCQFCFFSNQEHRFIPAQYF